MEVWQRQHILLNLTQLIESTDCNDSLLSALRSQKILSAEDVQIIQHGGTSVKKAHQLFDILPKRKQSYKALISALQKSCQSAAAEILLAGFLPHCPIQFQGNVCLLSELLPNLDETLKQELVSLSLQQQSCFDDVVVKKTIPEKLDYYIPRTIVSQRKLDKSLFQEKCSDVFLFQGLEWNELSLLANEFSTDVSSNLLDSSEQLKTRFVLLESLEHFEIIAVKTNEAIHLIQHINGYHQWVKSRGTIQTILRFVDSTADTIKEDNFINEILHDKISTCLTDSPGMGKTILLANLARAIVDLYPNRMIIFVYLREFIPTLQARLINGAQMNSQLIQTLLAEYSSEHPVGRRIVSHKLSDEPSHLCFDGFDEVVPEQRETAKIMLKMVADSFPNCQMLVTARLYMRRELEETIGTIGFHVAPFNMDNQVEFLVKFWKHRGSENKFIKDYARICLTTLATQMTEYEQGIAGIPLQCYMIGEVFLTRAKCYDPISGLGNEQVPIRSIAQLYHTLTNTKLDTLEHEDIREYLIQAHYHAAMTLIFPDDEVSKFVKYPKNITNEQMCRVGIMEHSKDCENVDGLRFVHRTFAEFFVGLFAAKLLHNIESKSNKFMFSKRKFVKRLVANCFATFLKRKHLQKFRNESLQFVLIKILSTYHSQDYMIDNPLGHEWLGISQVSAFQHPVIAYFLNFQLRQQKLKFELNWHVDFDPYEFGLFNFVRAAISHDCVDVLKLYVRLFEKMKYETLLWSDLYWFNLQLLAAKHASKDVIEVIFNLAKKNGSMEKTDLALYVAGYLGNYPTVEYLITSRHVNLDDASLVLHYCMWYSRLQSEAIIKRKVQIIKYLAQRSSSVLHTNWGGLTPILGKEIHLELIKCALETGCSVHDKKDNLKSLLHRAPKYMTFDAYHDILIFLSKSFEKLPITERDELDCTPLHYAVQYLPILSETLEIFLNHGADINAKDLEGNSVLFYALRSRTDLFLDLLEQNGAQLDAKNLKLETALHIAYKYCNISAVKWLIEQGANDQVHDTEGIIPSEAKLSSAEFRKAVRKKAAFVANGGKIKKGKILNSPLGVTNNYLVHQINGNKLNNKITSLHIEFCELYVDIAKIKFQYELKADFNARNFDGNTPLHLGVMNAFEISKDVLEFAVKIGGADLNLVNNYGYSVLTLAIYSNCDVSFLQLLVEYGADVCRLSNLEAAIRQDRLEHVMFLLESGADIIKMSRDNENGNNPIALAFEFYHEVQFEIPKILISSTPQLNFDNPKCISEIVTLAAVAYQESAKFRTVELFNLMASHGLNFTQRSANITPEFFKVVKVLQPGHLESFVKHLAHIGYTNLGEQKVLNMNVVQFFISAKKTDFPINLLSLLGNTTQILNSGDDCGMTVLWYAIDVGSSVEYIKELIQNGADVNLLDNNQVPLLHYAAWNGDASCVELFVDQVDNKNCVDGVGRSALQYVFEKNTLNCENAKVLISKGVEVNLESFSGTKTIETALTSYELWENSDSGGIFTLMLSHGLDLESSSFGSPVLLKMMDVLSIEDIEEVLKYLYNTNIIKCFHLRGLYGDTLLNRCLQNFIPSIDLLNIFELVGVHFDKRQVDNEISIDIGLIKTISTNAYQSNVNNVVLSVHDDTLYDQGIVSILKFVSEFGDDKSKFLFLLGAIRRKNLSRVKLLLEYGVDVVRISREGRDGMNPISFAFYFHQDAHFEIAKCLINSVPQLSFIDPKCIMTIFESALEAYQESEKFQTPELFNLLVSHGLDFAHCDDHGKPFIFEVVSVFTPTDCKCFVAHLNAVGLKNLFLIHDEDGRNLLFHCTNKVEIDKEFISIFSVNGVDFNLKDTMGQSILWHAISKNYNKESLEAFVLYGADPLMLDDNDDNLMLPAIFYQSRNAITFLVNAGVSLHRPNKSGLTAFMYACFMCIERIINFNTFAFITRSANLNQLSFDQTCELYIFLMKCYDSKNNKKFSQVFQIIKEQGLNPMSCYDNNPVYFNVVTSLELKHVEIFLENLVKVGYTNLGEIKNGKSMNVVEYFVTNTKVDFPINLLSLLVNVN